HFGVCGGCSLQHLEPRAQVAVKQRVLEETLWHIGRVRPGQILPAIHGPAWHYRHRARLTVRYVPKKGGALVGCHERRGSYVGDSTRCEILPARSAALLRPLRELVIGLSASSRMPQIEVSVGARVDVLVFRAPEPLPPEAAGRPRRFGAAPAVRTDLQPG